MALNNRDRVGRAFDLLSEGLVDVVDEVMSGVYGSTDWAEQWAAEDSQRFGQSRTYTKHDVQIQLRAITEKGKYFNKVLSRAQQGFASELRETRNLWAHSEPFSSDDTIRALDTIERLLHVVGSADSAEDVRKIRLDLQRTVYEDQTRKKVKRTKVNLEPGAGLRPWREVISPHDDVAKGAFTASEFAADLHLVHTGQATSAEYSDPVEFFNRTYLTEGLRDLLGWALRRMTGDASASPVVNLQTNFGGGKTHSMLALYHLFGGRGAQELPQEVQELISETTSADDLARLDVRRAVLVGTYLQAGSPLVKEDGTQVRTLWGELAWQLGGRQAYDIVADADQSGTNPGQALHDLIARYSPALILIDEWVAYARQLLTNKELPAGSFETQFTFAQSLTEAVAGVPGAMLVLSIPASDSGDSSRGSDIEIGGANGQMALERLQNVIGRVANNWRPSSKNESFEIVRRRLFQAPDAQALTTIAAVARNFVTFYRANPSLFPRDAAMPSDDYENRIRSCYPLHPELLDRLYEDWSTLERFQRTRGVLKLVSSIVHELWAAGDQSALILPGNVPLDANTVNTDLTQYLADQWKPIIDSDIDGDDSTAHQIDLERSNLGQRFVTQRVARTIFMGAAPRLGNPRKGLDKQYVWLGTAVPGDALGNFGLAIELLAQRSTYFYEDQGHYWFDTQPSVSKTANDYAERLREDPELVWNEIVRRLKDEERKRGGFSRVHVAPESSAEIPDLEDCRLVIVHPRYSRHKQDGADTPAHDWVRGAIETKGTGQRIHRNTLVFLMADRSELEALESSTRAYLGWKHVQAKSDSLNLTKQQQNQTDDSVTKFSQVVTDHIRDTYVWAVYPEQLDPTKPFELMADRVPDSGGKSLAERVVTKLVREEQFVDNLGAPILGAILHDQLQNVWDRGDVSVGDLWGYFTRYVYLHRLANREVLDAAIMQSLDAVLVPAERFAIATGKDEDTGRYRGLILPPEPGAQLQVTDGTLLVNWDRAQQQVDAERSARQVEQGEVGESGAAIASSRPAGGRADRQGRSGQAGSMKGIPSGGHSEFEAELRSRFFGSVQIDPERYSRDIGNVSREIIDRLVSAGAELEITIEIQAIKSKGFAESEIRTISENANVLKFKDSGFEES